MIWKVQKKYGQLYLVKWTYFHIIITYSIGQLDKTYNSISILKIPNNGLDIGAKMILLKYLKDNYIDYDYIYFMHSKTNQNLRLIYFDTLFDNIDIIVSDIYKYDGYFPNLLYKLYINYNIKLWPLYYYDKLFYIRYNMCIRDK